MPYCDLTDEQKLKRMESNKRWYDKRPEEQKEKGRECAKRYRNNLSEEKKEERKLKRNNYRRFQVENLTDVYIKQILKQEGIPVFPAMIELKRVQVQMKRALRKIR